MPEIAAGQGYLVWAVAVVAAAYARPQLARMLLSTLFLLMAVVNLITAALAPSAYQDTYGDSAVLPLYQDLLTGFWAQHDVALVLLSALVQLILGIAVLVPGRSRAAGLVGMIVLLLVVTPTAGSNLINLVFVVGAVLVLRAERAQRPERRDGSGEADALPPEAAAEEAPVLVAAGAVSAATADSDTVRGAHGLVRTGGPAPGPNVVMTVADGVLSRF
jgi:hypothetical protein